jgi:DNA-binding NtrC family response regulator
MLANAILCVDDRDPCSNLSDILDDIGYQVDVAYNMSDALNALARKNYLVGVFTFGRPDVDGVQLWKQLNNGRGKHACVMLMDEMQSGDLFDAVRTLGDHCLLIKPIDVARMIAFIDNAAAQPMEVSEIEQSLVPDNVRAAMPTGNRTRRSEMLSTRQPVPSFCRLWEDAEGLLRRIRDQLGVVCNNGYNGASSRSQTFDRAAANYIRSAPRGS